MTDYEKIIKLVNDVSACNGKPCNKLIMSRKVYENYFEKFTEDDFWSEIEIEIKENVSEDLIYVMCE